MRQKHILLFCTALLAVLSRRHAHITSQPRQQSAQPLGELSPYIEFGGEVWMRVTYRQTGPVFFYPWSARIDRARFVTSN